MSVRPVLLSVFPGVDLLGRAFEEEWPDSCIVRGPDVIFGGDIRAFHPPPGVFHGVFGGPPCQRWSRLSNVVRAVHGEDALAEDLIPEFARIVMEAKPRWYLMENVPPAPLPVTPGYFPCVYQLQNRSFGAEQQRVRKFVFGTTDGLDLDIEDSPEVARTFAFAVTSSSGGRRARVVRDANGSVRGRQGTADHQRLQRRAIAELCRLQGMPEDFLAEAPFTVQGKRRAIANGVPLAMGRAVARAVRCAWESAPRPRAPAGRGAAGRQGGD